MKRAFAFLLCNVALITAVGCGDANGNNAPTVSVPKYPTYTLNNIIGSKTDDKVGFQLENPEIGEEIVILKTNKGDIYIIPVTLFTIANHWKQAEHHSTGR